MCSFLHKKYEILYQKKILSRESQSAYFTKYANPIYFMFCPFIINYFLILSFYFVNNINIKIIGLKYCLVI